MNLRCDDHFDALSLLICSKTTKLNEWNSFKHQPTYKNISLIVLKDDIQDEHLTRQVFSRDENLFQTDLRMEYLSADNVGIIKEQLMEMVQAYKARC